MNAMKNMAEYRNKYYPLLTKPVFFPNPGKNEYFC